MARADDAGVVGVAGEIRIEAVHAAARGLGKAVALVLGQQHVVRGDAGLAGVEQLAHHDALHGVVEIGMRADDGRRLPAQLQRHRREVGGGGAHHVMADVGRAGEQQVVEG
ncbi:hypothetical protein D3C86_1810810 [compost metagenome]